MLSEVQAEKIKNKKIRKENRKMNNFEEFVSNVIENIRGVLPEEDRDAVIETVDVKKNNDVRKTGLVIKKAEDQVMPVVYMEDCFEAYKHGRSYEDIVQSILGARKEALEDMNFNLDFSFEEAKNKIIPRVVNFKENEEFLADKPYRKVMDLAVYYRIVLDIGDRGMASAEIVNGCLEKWGCTENMLYEIATENMIQMFPVKCRLLTDMIFDITGKNPIDAGIGADDIYVITNYAGINGANVILDENTLKMMQEKLGDYYILPSSVHELLLVPMSEKLDDEYLRNMVQEVNEDIVSETDRLSNNIYTYTDAGLQVA